MLNKLFAKIMNTVGIKHIDAQQAEELTAILGNLMGVGSGEMWTVRYTTTQDGVTKNFDQAIAVPPLTWCDMIRVVGSMTDPEGRRIPAADFVFISGYQVGIFDEKTTA